MGGLCCSITRQTLRHSPNISGEDVSDGELLVEMDVALRATSVACVLQQSQLYGRVMRREPVFIVTVKPTVLGTGHTQCVSFPNWK